jgi:signal transduction histidine kinase/PAS domain-containing protein
MSFLQWFTAMQQYLGRHRYMRIRPVSWRHPLVGYAVSVLLVALGMIIGLIETRYLPAFTFPGILLLFAVVPVALFWSVGPALLTVLLSILVLDYFYVPPIGALGDHDWNSVLRLLTFAISGIVIALLTNQREVARLQAVEAQREAIVRTRELEALFNAINDAIVVYDTDGQVLQTNTATSVLFGLQHLPEHERAEMQRTLLQQAACSNAQGKLMSVPMQPLTRLLRGEMLPGNSAADVMVRTADGRIAQFNLSGSPIQGASGAIERAVLIYRDVTERRRLEQRTAAALEALLAMAQVLAQTSAISHEPGQTISESVIHQQVGQRLVELTMNIIECIHVVLLGVEKHDDEEIVTPIAAVGLTSSQEERWREQLRFPQSLISYVGSEQLVSFLRRDEVLLLEGASLPFYASMFPSYVQTVLVAPVLVSQQLVGLLCVDDGGREHAYTASEMKLAQTTARLLSLHLARTQLQREYMLMQARALAARETACRMEEFLSIICHELKTPLTVMSGNLQLAERKIKRLLDTQGRKITLDSIDEQVLLPLQHLLMQAESQVVLQTRLINDLLEVARTQTGNLRICMKTCDLLPLVQRAVEQQRQIAGKHVILLEIPAMPVLHVYADPDRIMQVLTNFLSNALKYSPEGMPIEVWLDVKQEQVRVSVRDKGPGIPEAEQEHIWERFYRSVEARNNAQIGLGVGLYLCRMIIEQHGGNVGVESVPGQGATFWFTLPLMKSVAEKARTEE